MPNQHLSLDDIYNSEVSEGSLFKAVKMMSQEARFLNEQSNMGFIKLDLKPTTIAMEKFKNNRISDITDEIPEMVETSEDYGASSEEVSGDLGSL
jgi:hypothetical protein